MSGVSRKSDKKEHILIGIFMKLREKFPNEKYIPIFWLIYVYLNNGCDLEGISNISIKSDDEENMCRIQLSDSDEILFIDGESLEIFVNKNNKSKNGEMTKMTINVSVCAETSLSIAINGCVCHAKWEYRIGYDKIKNCFFQKVSKAGKDIENGLIYFNPDESDCVFLYGFDGIRKIPGVMSYIDSVYNDVIDLSKKTRKLIYGSDEGIN